MVGVGIKPISYLGTERLVHSAISYAIKYKRRNVTLVHKGNIMKFTEGAFRDWGYKVAKDFFGAVEIDAGPWCRIPDGRPGAGLVIKDSIADITLQQVLTRPDEFDVIATPNLNGDYLSDALAAQVGGIGIAPGGNINSLTGHAIFEATHGTAPKYADQDKVNPGSVVLSGEMMFRHHGVDGGRRLDHQRDGRGDLGEDRDLRFRPIDGRRQRSEVLRVRGCGDRAHVKDVRSAPGRQEGDSRSRHAEKTSARDVPGVPAPRRLTFVTIAGWKSARAGRARRRTRSRVERAASGTAPPGRDRRRPPPGHTSTTRPALRPPDRCPSAGRRSV